MITLVQNSVAWCTMFFFFLLGSFVSGQTFPAVSDMGDITAVKNPPEVLYQTHWQESLDREDADEDQKHFCMLMERLGAISVFEEWVMCVCVCLCLGLSVSYLYPKSTFPLKPPLYFKPETWISCTNPPTDRSFQGEINVLEHSLCWPFSSFPAVLYVIILIPY